MLTTPPIVAPGPGPSHTGFRNIPKGRHCHLTLTGKERGIPAYKVLVGVIIYATQTDLFLSAPCLHPPTELLLDKWGPNPLARMISPYTQDSFPKPYRESRESCPSETCLCHRQSAAKYDSAIIRNQDWRSYAYSSEISL